MVRPGGDAGATFPEVSMLGSDYPKIRARHIEAPTRRFLCEYHHAAYRPHGVPLPHPGAVCAVKNEGIPVCSECGGPMHLESSDYGRAWECDRGRDLRARSAGPMRIEDREPLTELQVATAMARRSFGDSKERSKDQANYRRQHATDTKGNFVFDRTVTLAHSQCMLDRRRKR